jgi:hypothetical protein
MAYSAIQLSANALYQGVTQTGYSLAVGDVVRFDGTNFVKAQADSIANAAMVGIVSRLNGSNQFYITQEGFVSGITTQSFTPGVLYYLDPSNAGRLTATRPNTVGQILAPCFIAYTADSGFFFEDVGTVIGTDGMSVPVIVTTNTVMVPNTFYLTNSLSSITMTIPNTVPFGSTFRVSAIEVGGIVIQMGASQTCNYLDDDTSLAGTITLQPTGGILLGGMEILCYTANLDFQTISGEGNWLFA